MTNPKFQTGDRAILDLSHLGIDYSCPVIIIGHLAYGKYQIAADGLPIVHVSNNQFLTREGGRTILNFEGYKIPVSITSWWGDWVGGTSQVRPWIENGESEEGRLLPRKK